MNNEENKILPDFAPFKISLEKAGAQIIEIGQVYPGNFEKKMIKKTHDRTRSNSYVLILCSCKSQTQQCVRVLYTPQNMRKVNQIILNAATGIPIEKEVDENHTPPIKRIKVRLTKRFLEERQ